jgi:hypothetical protein
MPSSMTRRPPEEQACQLIGEESHRNLEKKESEAVHNPVIL